MNHEPLPEQGPVDVNVRAQYADEFLLDLHDIGYWMARWHKTTYPIGKDKAKAQAIISRLNAAHRPNLELRGKDLWVYWNEHENGEYEMLVENAL